MSRSPVGTTYRRALRRVQRRALAYQRSREDARALQLLLEACRLANDLSDTAPLRRRKDAA